MIAKKGQRFRVINFQKTEEEGEVFYIGDIVISLENNSIPCCILENEYIKDCKIDDYPSYSTMAIMSYGEDGFKDELEPLED